MDSKSLCLLTWKEFSKITLWKIICKYLPGKNVLKELSPAAVSISSTVYIFSCRHCLARFLPGTEECKLLRERGTDNDSIKMVETVNLFPADPLSLRRAFQTSLSLPSFLTFSRKSRYLKRRIQFSLWTCTILRFMLVDSRTGWLAVELYIWM